MSPKIEKLNENEQWKTEQRILSDAELIKTGARIKEDGRLEVANDQIEKMKEDPESRFGKWGETKEYQGEKVRFSVRWVDYDNRYEIYIPDIEKVIGLGTDREFAERIYNFVSGLRGKTAEGVQNSVIRLIETLEATGN
ncbi:MAG: hypothetical protein A3J76_05525 [Candidatus Moranbacteria bacterium RBG_13_45_13]|nr:MAG: hypothetical protein A3J76_05525 [Candidatus Moranbacteria bacterium RBG_13_45_13]